MGAPMTAALALWPETMFASFSTLSTDLGGIIGSVGGKRQGNQGSDEKKGKFAQTDTRSGHQALR
jgi:hypothetical protein